MNSLSHKKGISVRFSLAAAAPAACAFYTIQGKCVWEKRVTVNSGVSMHAWNLGSLANGNYSLSAKAGKHFVRQAILIMN
jgi:hypothetical protein